MAFSCSPFTCGVEIIKIPRKYENLEFDPSFTTISVLLLEGATETSKLNLDNFLFLLGPKIGYHFKVFAAELGIGITTYFSLAIGATNVFKGPIPFITARLKQ